MMKPNVKWWLLVALMLALVLGPRMIFAQGAEGDAEHVSERSETLLTIEFTRIYPVPEAFHEPIAKAMEKERSFLPNVDEWTVSAFRSTEEWAQIILVPTYIVEEDWKNAPTDDEIIEVVAYLSDGKWEAYLTNGDLFTNIKSKIPRDFIDYSRISTPLPYLFSWTSGQSWYKTEGWHQGNAIDFAPDQHSDPSVHYAVLAANSGILSEVCNDGYQSFLKVEHSDGSTQYWHLDSATARLDLLGQNVPRGQFLGQLYNGTAHVNGACNPNEYDDPLRYNTGCGCGTGLHLHFVLSDQNIEIDGHNANNVANAPKDTQFLSSNERVDNPDADPPTTSASFSGTSGSNGWYRSNVQVTLTANEEDVNWIEYRINPISDDPWTRYNSPFLISNEGSNTLQYYAQDTSGNTESTKSATVKIDKSAPTSSCSTSPASSSGWYNTPPTITCSGSDSVSGLEGIQYRINGDGDDPWQTYGDSFTVPGEGEHTVAYYAEDQAGHPQAEQSLDVNVDQSAPSLTSFSINNDASTTHNRTVLLTSSASDARSGVAQMCASYNQIEWECRAYEESTPFALPLIDLHSVNVYFYVTDAASNESAVLSDTIALDFYPPMPHSANYRVCQDVMNAAGRSDLTSNGYALTSSFAEPVVSTSPNSNSYRSRSGFLADLEGCLPIERTTFGYSLIQSVIASGGNSRHSTTYRVSDTLGEPVVSQSSQSSPSLVRMESSSYRLTSGFWGNLPIATTSSSMSLQLGWNAVAWPFSPELSYTAESLCEEMNGQGGNVVEIDRWHTSGWEGHICGLPFNDFAIEMGASYFIKSNGTSSWSMSGYRVTEPLSLTLQVGWNSISIPHTDAYTAESLCDDMIAQGVNAVEIDRWHNSGWQGHICGLPFNDFAIERGTGYFVKSDSSGTVTPSESPTSLRQPGKREALPLQLDEVPVGKAMPVRDLRISNLNDTSVTLSWLTDEATTGYVLYGEGQVALDVRGAAHRRAHYVTLTSLKPETRYDLKVVSGAESDEGQPASRGIAPTLTITTAPTLSSLPSPDTVYGQVFFADGVTPATDVLLYLTLQDADGAGDTAEATLLSALTDEQGYWHANLGNARLMDDGSQPFVYSETGDVVLLSAQSGTGSPITHRQHVADLRPAAPLLLEQTAPWQLYLPLIVR